MTEISKWFDQPLDPVAETEWTVALDRIAELLNRDFGLRCDAYSPTCGNCIAWHAHDTLRDITMETDTVHKRWTRK